MKYQALLAIFPIIGAFGAPLGTAAPAAKRSEATVPIWTVLVGDDESGVEKRAEATVPIFTVFASDTDEAKKLAKKMKRAQDIDNLVLSVTVFTDDQPDKVKRGEVKRGEDIDNLVLTVAVYADDQPDKVKRDVAKRGQDIDNLVLSVNVAEVEVEDKREAKLISPYTDDVEAADPHAVLGEKH